MSSYDVRSAIISAVVHEDESASPLDYLFQDEDYRDEDQARLDAYNRGDWSFIGVQAMARVTFCLSGIPTGSAGTEIIRSGGLWGVESDSDEAFLAETYADEVSDLKDRLEALGITEDKIVVLPFSGA